MKKKIKWLIQKIFGNPQSKSIKRRIVGKNNIFSNNGTLLNGFIDIEGDNNQIFIDEYSELSNCHFYIRGNNHLLKIGKGCRSSNGSFWFEDDHCSVTIEDSTTLEDAHIAVIESGSKVHIGKGSMFAVGIIIRTSDSHSIIDIGSGKRINPAANVILGEKVWLGAFTNILKGVEIGDNSIIGTGSIVTSNIPSNSLAAGIPAKVIKKNVKWLVQRI